MIQDDIIQQTLKDSNYHLSLFSEDEIITLRRKVVIKESKGRKTPFVTCIVREKDIQLKPEEIVRQLYAARLIKYYGYPKKRLAFEYLVNKSAKGENKYFNFDILMANPPFAGDIKESRILHQYELGFNSNRKAQSKVGRDILFIERNLDFLKPGGRMAIVLPQGRFNNTTDKPIRDFIAQHGRILAVIGLHGNTFKPHTGTKTSVLFVQKWDDKLCPKVDDYPIFFAVSEKGGKDNSGDYIYVKNGNGQYKLDKNGHLIVDHDLHNHNGALPDGIAEAFIEFAKSEVLSFWK